jgi:hypothetical protein
LQVALVEEHALGGNEPCEMAEQIGRKRLFDVEFVHHLDDLEYSVEVRCS